MARDEHEQIDAARGVARRDGVRQVVVDHAIGASLALAYFVSLLWTAPSLGFPRDEGVYFRAAASYAGWWQSVLGHGAAALRQGAIDRVWSVNHEHPPLMKALFGLSWWLLHERWHLVQDESTAFRIPAMLLAGAALWITYLFGARAWSRRAGLVAALLLGLMPRVFFHAHLACFDVPILAMWILCVYVYWRAQETESLPWVLSAGVVFGLALATKHNAWMLPAVFVPHAVFLRRSAAVRAGRRWFPASLVAMAVVGPAVLFILWPYLWYETWSRLRWYVDFHLQHPYYDIEYLGRNYFGPPSPKSYLPVMVVATIPAITLVLFAAGAMERGSEGARRFGVWVTEYLGLPVGERRLGRWRDALRGIPRDPLETDLLLFLSLAVAAFPFFRSSTPIFGGTKHWLPMYPALALIAGRGFELVVLAAKRALRAVEGRGWLGVQTALVACVVLAPLILTIDSYPFGLSTYMPIVGGTAGGATLGLNRQFWGYTSQNAAEEYVNAKAPSNATVFIHDTTLDAWFQMEKEGRLRGDLRATLIPHEAQVALVEHELHMNEVDYSIWAVFGSVAPAYVVEHDGVPIVSVYRRP